jgi:hypothetical protein
MEIIIKKLKKTKPPFIPKTTELILLGLTPGKVQHKSIDEAKDPREGAFKGPMRRKLYQWFKEIGVAKHFKLENEDDLFKRPDLDQRVFISSLLRDPVYYSNEKNYSGRDPYPWKHEKLTKLMMETIILLNSAPKTALIIPCGDIVSQALEMYLKNDLKKNVLFGFPHPSGLNSHAPKKFEKGKIMFKKRVLELLK